MHSFLIRCLLLICCWNRLIATRRIASKIFARRWTRTLFCNDAPVTLNNVLYGIHIGICIDEIMYWFPVPFFRYICLLLYQPSSKNMLVPNELLDIWVCVCYTTFWLHLLKTNLRYNWNYPYVMYFVFCAMILS